MIPKRQFAMPETFLLKMGEGIGKKTVVAHHKRFQPKQDVGECGENQQRQEDSKAHRREKFFSEVVAAGRLHAQIKSGGGAKCNVVVRLKSEAKLQASSSKFVAADVSRLKILCLMF
jgi:hypothetical protein